MTNLIDELYLEDGRPASRRPRGRCQYYRRESLLAARIRDQIDTALEPEHAAWVALLAGLRPEVLAVDPGRRRAVFDRL